MAVVQKTYKLDMPTWYHSCKHSVSACQEERVFGVFGVLACQEERVFGISACQEERVFVVSTS